MNRSEPAHASRWICFLSDLRFLGGVLIICGLLGLALNLLRARPLALWKAESASDALVQTDSTRHDSRGNAEAQRMDLEEAMSAFQRKTATFVDARDQAFFELGHIPGAASLPRRAFDKFYPDFESATKKDAPLIIYCTEADCPDSTIVGNILLSRGYSSIKVFPGGWQEWSAAGLPKEP